MRACNEVLYTKTFTKKRWLWKNSLEDRSLDVCPGVKRTLFSIRFVPRPRSINSLRLTTNRRIYILTAHGDEGWFAVNPPSPKPRTTTLLIITH